VGGKERRVKICNRRQGTGLDGRMQSVWRNVDARRGRERRASVLCFCGRYRENGYAEEDEQRTRHGIRQDR
jgi:hypothetical protein